MMASRDVAAQSDGGNGRREGAVMGTMYEWRCARCGAGESFVCGGGMTNINEREVIRTAGEGGLGPAMARLLGQGLPNGWSVFRSWVYYRCPECDATYESMTLDVDDRSHGKLTYTAAPGPCPACGVEAFDGSPMGEDEIFERRMSRERNGCPACGCHEVSFSFGNWDLRPGSSSGARNVVSRSLPADGAHRETRFSRCLSSGGTNASIRRRRERR